MDRISIKQYRKLNGWISETEWKGHLNDLTLDSVCPALCSYGCEVEPDGECEHGHPSVLVALGLI
jgi:hypothetical protein